MILRDLLVQNAQKRPHALAVKGPDAALSYGELDQLANRFAQALAQHGVQRGDRVGIWLAKSAYAVAAMQGVLRLSAIYVPLDPLSPAARIRTIVRDCEIRALITTQQRAQAIQTEHLHPIAYLCLDDDRSISQRDDLPNIEFAPAHADDIAYILYTSGSTGIPKGVCISHRNALAFVEWAAHMLQVTANDRFANHAPLHFDLSVFDLYVAFYAGAAVYLIPDEASYIPERLVSYLMQDAITIWYSVPSVLILMMERGGLYNVPLHHLRFMLFAGETFPIKHLRRLYAYCNTGAEQEKSDLHLANNTLSSRSPVRFFNLYGPTETNVCTFYEVTHLSPSWQKSVPIGKACSGNEVWAQKPDGTLVQPGEVGELMVHGPTVMVGYWGQPAYAEPIYATGDIVQLLDDGNYTYNGRRDQMIKIRGHRIELGDIEAALEHHPDIHEVAVIVTGTGLAARLVACIVSLHSEISLSLLEVKRYCSEQLPRYMIVDDVHILSALPRTRNGKIDRVALSQALE